MADIHYINNNNINAQKWNECIYQSINGLIYAEYDYLTQMSKHWDALVLNNYEAVMPLVWNQKWGIKYLYQPPFFQQGGIFCKHNIDAALVEAFMNKAKLHFAFAEITLNYKNPEQQLPSTFHRLRRNNFILPLQNKYSAIKENYHPDVKQSLKNKPHQKALNYELSSDFKLVIDAYKNNYHHFISRLKKSDIKKFETLCQIYSNQGRLLVRKIKNPDDNVILAMVLLLKDQRRLYNIISVVSNEGKKRFANYFLYDSLIREFAETDLILDFEGSELEGVAYFYKKFGTINQPYPFVSFNQLPKIIRWLK